MCVCVWFSLPSCGFNSYCFYRIIEMPHRFRSSHVEIIYSINKRSTNNQHLHRHHYHHHHHHDQQHYHRHCHHHHYERLWCVHQPATVIGTLEMGISHQFWTAVSYAVIGRHGADRGRDLDGIVVDVLDRVGGAQISTFFERALQMRDIACLQLEGAIKKCSPHVLRSSERIRLKNQTHLQSIKMKRQ